MNTLAERLRTMELTPAELAVYRWMVQVALDLEANASEGTKLQIALVETTVPNFSQSDDPAVRALVADDEALKLLAGRVFSEDEVATGPDYSTRMRWA